MTNECVFNLLTAFWVRLRIDMSDPGQRHKAVEFIYSTQFNWWAEISGFDPDELRSMYLGLPVRNNDNPSLCLKCGKPLTGMHPTAKRHSNCKN